jgi:hypothetical protein
MQGWRKLPSLSSKPCWLQGDLHTSRTPRLTNHQTRVSVQRSGAPPNRQQSRLPGCFTCTTLCCAATSTTCSTIAADGWHVAARHCRPASCQPRRTACSNEHAVCRMSNEQSLVHGVCHPLAMCLQTVLCLVRWHLWCHPPSAAGQPKRGPTTSLPRGKQQQRTHSITTVAVSKKL